MFSIFYRDTDEGDLYFPSYMYGVLNLVFALTTDTTPDVMLPGYKESPFSILLWMVFVWLGIFILMNLVLAVVFNTYKNQLLDDSEKIKAIKEVHLHKAFIELDVNKTGFVNGQQMTSQ